MRAARGFISRVDHFAILQHSDAGGTAADVHDSAIFNAEDGIGGGGLSGEAAAFKSGGFDHIGGGLHLDLSNTGREAAVSVGEFAA